MEQSIITIHPSEETELLLDSIRSALKKSAAVTVDFSGTGYIDTPTARSIFRTLFIELGPEEFYDRIALINTSDTVYANIEKGLMSAD